MLALAKMMTAGPWWRGPSTDPRETMPTCRAVDGGAMRPRAGAVRRMAEKFGHLLPADSSAAAFDSWLAATGTDVPADELADLYADICLLAGWPVAGDGAVMPADPAAASDAIEPAPCTPAAVSSRQIKLGTAEAALRFRDWLFECRRDGTYTSAELTDLYAEHCQAEDLIPHAENEMRRHLQRLGGVKKSNVTIHVKTHRGRERNRNVRWVFQTPKAFWETHRLEAVDVPWTELPDRRKAA